MTKDEEAEKIIDRLKKTDKEREEEHIEQISQILQQYIHEEIMEELDKRTLKEVTDFINGKGKK